MIKVLTGNPHANIEIVWHVITQDAFRCPFASIMYMFCLSRPLNLKVSRNFSMHSCCVIELYQNIASIAVSVVGARDPWDGLDEMSNPVE